VWKPKQRIKNENRKKVLKCYADTKISPISKLASENSHHKFRLRRRQLKSSYFFVAYPGRERACRGGSGEEEKERVKVRGMEEDKQKYLKTCLYRC